MSILNLVDIGDHFRGTVSGGKVPIMAWTKGVEFEESAQQQIANLSQLPFVYKQIVVLPDVHFGIGATVGSVIATRGAVVPASCGVDIGCGINVTRTSLTASDLPDNLHALRLEIEKRIPHGRTNNGGDGDRGAWHNVPQKIEEQFSINLASRLKSIVDLNPKIAVRGMDATEKRACSHLSSLGTGNHYIEVCLDEEQRVWVMLHSGSRGIGNRIGSYFIEQAKEQAAKYFYEESLPDKDLAWLVEGTPIFNQYIEAVLWAQDYAALNRSLMMDAALSAFSAVNLDIGDTSEIVSCHHNYISRERHFGQDGIIVTRKGAVRAGEGDMGIIPGSMGAKSFIVRGKGNRDSFESCSHGAGRRMGRNEAKRQITQEAFDTAMAGIESRHDKDVIDEAPQAYKDVDAVIAAQHDLIDVVHTLRQVLVVKG